MSAIYTTTTGSITIGGTALTGPFPKYGITRESVELSDGTTISYKYNISLTGTILTASDADITVSGDMQSKLHAKIIEKLRTNLTNGHNIGTLEIVPYGGQPNPIVFLDAKIVNIEIPQQPDESAGILYSDYSFTFEATQDVSNGDPPLFDYNIKSAEESWQITQDEETIYSLDVSLIPYKTYTITHTLSSSGNVRFDSGPIFNSSAWKQAAEWCKSRLVNSPADQILTDAVGNTQFTDFTATVMDESAGIASPNLGSYGFYNHVRTPNVDLTSGSYSITETWKASNLPALLDFEVNISQDESENTTVSLNGTITGLDTSPVNTNSIDKLSNAETVLSYIDSSAFTVCDAYYSIPGGTLQSVVRSKNITKNKGTGVISFGYTYNDIPVLIEGAISTSLRFTDDNEYRLNRIIAIIPIIAKPDGPIIQDMNTTNERKRSVQMDAVMRKSERATRPSSPVPLVLGYAPTDAKLQALVENWEPNTGVYSINVEWVY